MKRQWSICAIVLLSVSSVHAFNILVDGYTLENYASYSSTTFFSRMEFDGSGNLYINHWDDGKIKKIDSSHQVSTLATGLGNLYDMVWGGGTGYGDFLYSTCQTSSHEKIYKTDVSTGNTVQFAPMTGSGAAAINIDKTGNYSNQMYVGTAIMDRIDRVTTSGVVSTFTTWPGQHGGGVYGLTVDTTGNYNGKMYVANMYDPVNADISGLFMVNPDGTVSRFSNNIASAVMLEIDSVGTYFNHDMFVYGRTNFTDQNTLWRVSSNGVAQEFMRGVWGFTFGTDGAMYAASYDWNMQVVTVARVVPEPATLLLLATGGLFLKRRSI